MDTTGKKVNVLMVEANRATQSWDLQIWADVDMLEIIEETPGVAMVNVSKHCEYWVWLDPRWDREIVKEVLIKVLSGGK